MNSVSTTIVTDFVQRFRKDIGEASALRLARGITLALGVLGTASALLMASSDVKSLWDQYIAIIGLFGGGVAGLFTLGVFTRRAHAWGALAGLVVSALLVFLAQKYTSMNLFLYAPLGTFGCVLIGYLVSVILPGTSPAADGLTLYTLRPVTTRPPEE